MDTNQPYVGDHTPLIKLAGSEPRGIRQTGVNFIKGATYNGRIQMAGDASAKVSVSIVWGTNADAARQTIQLGKLGKNYKKYTFSFKAENSGPAQFEISGTGTGSFHIGAVSLMPADNRAGLPPGCDRRPQKPSLRRLPCSPAAISFPPTNGAMPLAIPTNARLSIDPVWHALQPNDIGTDEFMTLCKLLGVEPYITSMPAFGDARSAAQYVEYANGAVTTPMGKLRAANGHPEPYHVKFWGIGNEAWGAASSTAPCSSNSLKHKHNQFAKAMRKVDPTIILIASGAMPDTMTGSKQSLNFGTNLVPALFLARRIGPAGCSPIASTTFDLISEHYYNYGNTHFSLAEGRQVPNDPNEPITDWMRRPANHVRIKYEEYKEYEKVLPQACGTSQAPEPRRMGLHRRRAVIRLTRPTPGCSMKCSGTRRSFQMAALHLCDLTAGPRWHESSRSMPTDSFSRSIATTSAPSRSTSPATRLSPNPPTRPAASSP